MPGPAPSPMRFSGKAMPRDPRGKHGTTCQSSDPANRICEPVLTSFGDWLGSGGEKAKACKAQRLDVCNPAKTSSQKRIMCQVEMQMEHVQRFIFSGLRGSGVKPCLGGAGPFQLGALPRRWGFSRRWKLQPFLLGPSNAWP